MWLCEFYPSYLILARLKETEELSTLLRRTDESSLTGTVKRFNVLIFETAGSPRGMCL